MQPDLTEKILELIRRTSSSLPADVEKRLKASIEKEAPGSAARGATRSSADFTSLSRASGVSPRNFSSFSTRKPTTLGVLPIICGTVSIEALSRCAVPNASSTS